MLSKTIYYGQIPLLKEIVVSDRDFHLGLELSFKRDNFSTSILDSKNPLLVTPHYIKSIKENSLARDYEFRIGDRLLAINDEDVSTYDHAIVSEIVKKVVNSTKKLCSNKPSKQCGSSLSLKWFKKRQDESQREKRNIVILVSRYHVPPVPSQAAVVSRRPMTIRSVYTDTGGNFNSGTTRPITDSYITSPNNSCDSPNDSVDILETLVNRMTIVPHRNHQRRRSVNTSLPNPIAFTISPPLPNNSLQHSPNNSQLKNSFKQQQLLSDKNNDDDNISIMTPTSDDLFPEFR